MGITTVGTPLLFEKNTWHKNQSLIIFAQLAAVVAAIVGRMSPTDGACHMYTTTTSVCLHRSNQNKGQMHLYL